MNEYPETNELPKKKSCFKRHMEIILAKIWADRQAWRSRLAFALCVPVSYLMVEILNENNPFTDLELWQVAWNLVWYTVLLALSWLVFRKRRRSAAITAVFCFAFGVLNHFVFEFRGKTIFPSDITSWRTAANVAGGYSFAPDGYVYGALAILVAYLALLIIIKGEKGKKKFPKTSGAIIGGTCLAFLIAFFCTGLLPYFHVYAQQWNTQNNGFLFNFMVSLRYSFVSEPDGYSTDEVEALQSTIMDEIVSSGGEEAYSAVLNDDGTPTNIIVIMNESFADLSFYENYSVSKDPLEFFHSLTENTIKGWMYSPVEGGGTATVEFEYLTGDSAAFLPEGTVAYQIYIDSYTPTLVSALDSLGYESWAFHPYLASGWNRPVVYDLFGFDHQMYQDDLTDPGYVRGYVSDSSDYETLYSITDSAGGKKTFIFNVTMQNHSGYGQNWNNLKRSVTLTGGLKGTSDTAEQYFSLIDASDKAIEELITHYSKVDESTMIVFFGDHQPYLSEDFFASLYGKPLDERTDEEILEQYKTPFFIWTNYDIEEQEDVCISSSFLSVLTMQTAKLPLTGYMELLSEVMQELPVINRIGIITSDGEFVSDRESLSLSRQELLESYEANAYYHLFDRTDETDAFYELPKLSDISAKQQ